MGQFNFGDFAHFYIGGNSIELSRSSCLNWMHRLGFAFKRPKKRLLKADEAKREAFVAEYAVLREEAPTD